MIQNPEPEKKKKKKKPQNYLNILKIFPWNKNPNQNHKQNQGKISVGFITEKANFLTT